jgi:ankyrin repeat protein
VILMPIQVLPPDEAAKKAKERVAEWKRQREIDAAKTKMEAGKARSAPQNTEGQKPAMGQEEKKTLNHALFVAVYKGDVNSARDALERGADVNSRDDYSKETALMGAAKKGHREVVELLIAKGADVNAVIGSSQNRCGALTYAARENHVDIVRLLIAKGAKVFMLQGANALRLAAHNNHTRVSMILIEHGAQVNNRGDNNKTTLMEAVQNGNEELVKNLIQHRADVNARKGNGVTPLMIAVDKGDVKIVMILLDQGADVTARSHVYSHKSRKFVRDSGATALARAMKKGNNEIVAILKKHGATE